MQTQLFVWNAGDLLAGSFVLLILATLGLIYYVAHILDKLEAWWRKIKHKDNTL